MHIHFNLIFHEYIQVYPSERGKEIEGRAWKARVYSDKCLWNMRARAVENKKRFRGRIYQKGKSF